MGSYLTWLWRRTCEDPVVAAGVVLLAANLLWIVICTFSQRAWEYTRAFLKTVDEVSEEDDRDV